MKYYKLKYKNGNIKYCKGKNSLEIIKKYDLCTRDNIETRIIELEGEQKAIAIDYLSNF